MELFEHGGNIYKCPGCLDFSANLNPLGMPAAAHEALCNNIEAFESYPDPNCTGLTHALAAYEHVPASWVLPCAGATDAFTRICQAYRPRHALVCAPCYSGYEQALRQAGSQVIHHDLSPDTDFALTPSFVGHVTSSTDLICIANPNNPTGRPAPRDVLLACLDRANAIGALVVLDECFVDLSDLPSSNDLLAQYDNLVLVKALTKTFSLAGLRVGHAMCANELVLRRMRDAGQPWAVSVPAQLAGVACTHEPAHVEKARELVATERRYLHDALQALGLHVIPGRANYLLFEGATGLSDELLARDIMIRPCDNYRGLDEHWYRIAVRQHAHNELLLSALREVLM